MKKNTKKLVILMLFAVLVACVAVLCACKGNPLTRDDLVNNGYSVVVKYDFNGGLNKDSVGSVVIYVRPGSRIPEPDGKGASFGMPSKANCSFRGFYVGEENSDGVVEYSDTPWNFATDTVTEDITLYALWWDNFVVAVHCDDVAGQDRVHEVTISRDAQTGAAETVLAGYMSATQLGMNGRTIISYYTDQEQEHEITFPATLDFKDEEGSRRIDIYVESRAGSWAVVRTADEFVNMLSQASATTRNFFIKNDLNLEGKTVKFPDYYSGTFDGNGNTIYNISLTQTVPSSVRGTAYFGLFRELRDGASVVNVNFSNVTLIANTSGGAFINEVFVGMFAGYIYNNVTLANVTISGKLTYTDASGIVVNKFAGYLDSRVDVTTCHYDDVTVEMAE